MHWSSAQNSVGISVNSNSGRASTNSTSKVFLVLHDVRLLIRAIAYGESLNERSGGGSLSSNVAYLRNLVNFAKFVTKDAAAAAAIAAAAATATTTTTPTKASILSGRARRENEAASAAAQAAKSEASRATATPAVFVVTEMMNLANLVDQVGVGKNNVNLARSVAFCSVCALVYGGEVWKEHKKLFLKHFVKKGVGVGDTREEGGVEGGRRSRSNSQERGMGMGMGMGMGGEEGGGGSGTGRGRKRKMSDISGAMTGAKEISLKKNLMFFLVVDKLVQLGVGAEWNEGENENDAENEAEMDEEITQFIVDLKSKNELKDLRERIGYEEVFQEAGVEAGVE